MVGQRGRWFPTPGGLLHPCRTQNEVSPPQPSIKRWLLFLLVPHKCINIMKLVGEWGVLRCRYWWDLGPLPPYCTNAPIIFDPPRHWSAPTWARGQRCLKLKDLVSSSGVAVALLGLPSQLRVCRTKRLVTSVSDAAGPGGAYRASAARLKRPKPVSKFPRLPRIRVDAASENAGMGHVLL